MRCHFAHFFRNRRIFIGKCCMIRTTVDDTKCKSQSCKIRIDGSYYRVCRIFKINGYCISHGRSSLIHQSTRLTKIFIFCCLTDFCDFYCIKLVLTKQMISRCSNQHLTRCGGRQSGSRQYRWCHIHIKACYRISCFMKLGQHASYQRSSCFFFFFLHFQISKINTCHWPAFWLKMHNTRSV